MPIDAQVGQPARAVGCQQADGRIAEVTPPLLGVVFSHCHRSRNSLSTASS
jgi:hypothetical protein